MADSLRLTAAASKGPAARRFGAWVALLPGMCLLQACSGLTSNTDLPTLTTADFVRAQDAAPTVPAARYGELPSVDVTVGELEMSERNTDTAIEDAPRDPDAPPTAPQGRSREEVASRWLVDGLVGQINGRPVFAQEFLEPLEASLMLAAANPDRLAGRREFNAVIERSFIRLVNSELVISEAESQLSPEQQEGLFAWLRSLQEEEIAGRSGTRAEAQRQIEEDLGMSIDEFIQERRDRALADYLLRRKVEPRTIVSWRDVERFYRQNQAVINPPPVIRVGRISLSKLRDGSKIEEARRLFAEGKPFLEVGAALGVRDDGIWFVLPMKEEDTVAQTITGSPDLTEVAKTRLMALTPGVVPAPTETASAVEWIAIIDVFAVPKRSIYDAALQLQIKGTLKGAQQQIEEARYIARLRSRWVSDDIEEILKRLLDIADARYWR
jgi:hypothetical protein